MKERVIEWLIRDYITKNKKTLYIYKEYKNIRKSTEKTDNKSVQKPKLNQLLTYDSNLNKHVIFNRLVVNLNLSRISI